MIKVIGVRFRTAGKIYFFDPGRLHIKKGDHVIVETARGIEYGTVVGEMREVEEDKVIQPLKPVLRIATQKDMEQETANKGKEKEAFKICLEKIKKHSPLLILGLFFLGVCMRMPITAIPSVIKDIAQTFNVETTSLGILTTIPLLCFGLLSSVVSALAQRIGNELTIELAMILMFIGLKLIIFNNKIIKL